VNVITIDPNKCTGCRMCEVRCSALHFNEFNPDRSLIRVVLTEKGGMLDSVPVTCMQCERAMCELVCPSRAISRDTKTGARIINTTRCIGCSACSYACPFGACHVDRSLKTAVVCDLCDGDPACVKICPTDALGYMSDVKVNIALKRDMAEKLRGLTGQFEVKVQQDSAPKH